MSKDLLVLADEYAAATATFARALALKDEADSMSPIAREAGDKRAVLAEALAALDTAQPVPVNALLHAAGLESFADMLPAYGFTPKPLKDAAATIRALHAQVAAPSEAAREYMTGYSDGREWAAAPIPQQVAQPSVPEGWKQSVALAYGHLWHVNNEPMAPVPLRSSETAAYAARKQLRDLLTHEERGIAINQVQVMLAAAPQPKDMK